MPARNRAGHTPATAAKAAATSRRGQAAKRATGEAPIYCQRPGCTNHLTGKQKKYCSNACRAIDSHMRRRAEARMLTESLVLEEVREALAPVARELMTDEVLRNIHAMVNLLPQATLALAKNLASGDAQVRQKAADSLLKFTMGNPSVAPEPVGGDKAPLQVVIGAAIETPQLVRNEAVPSTAEQVPIAELAPGAAGDDLETPVDEGPLRECLECHAFKPPREFVGESPRCQVCHDTLMAQVAERFGPDVLPST